MQIQGAPGADQPPKRIWAPLYLTISYVIAGMIWIFASDGILLWITDSGAIYPTLQTYKGGAFIAFTGLALFLVSRRYFGTTMAALQAQLALASQVVQDQAIREAVFENLDEGLYVADSDGRTIMTNAAARRICKLKPGEDIFQPNKHLTYFKSDGVRSLSLDELPMHRAQRGETIEREEILIHGGEEPEGTWVLFSSRPCCIDSSGAPYTISVLRNVTKLKRAEQALRESEQSLSLLLANLPGMAFRSTPNSGGTLSFASAGCRYLTGYEPEALLAGAPTYRSLIHPEDWAKVVDTVAHACDAGFPYMVSYRITTADHQQKWIMEQGMPLYDEAGQCIAVEGFAGDVTAQRQAEERLHDQESYYRALIENLEDIIVEVAWDGTLLFASPAVERIMGYSPESIVGQKLFTFVHPDELPVLVRESRRIIRQGDTNSTLEFRLRDAQGAWRILEGRGRAVRNGQGTSTLIFNARDITARREAEEEKQLLTQALEQTAEGFAYIDCDERIRYMNKAFAGLLGGSVNGFEQSSLRKVLHLDFDDLAVSSAVSPLGFWDALAKGELWNGRATYSIQGAVLDLHLSPVRDAGGECKGSLLLITDLSDRVKLEDQVRRMQRLESIGTLAGGIAHDFNNILAAILGYTELAADAMDPGDSSHAMLKEVMKAGIRARELVHQILTFSRQHEQQRAPLQLHLIVKEALHLLRATVPSSVHLDEMIDKNCRPVLADPTQVHQVIMNLCTNAFQALPENGGRITVILEEISVDAEMARTTVDLREDTYARLSVRDTGCGMQPAMQARIFEPFFTTKEKGTGLGLSTVHGIVKSHEGALTLYSEPGVGTVFNVFLPLAEKLEITSVPVEQTIPRGAGEHVLLVDDEEALARVGEKILRRLGYQVTACTSSSEALRRFSAAPDSFDLLLTDMQMPGMTGLALLRKVRQIRGTLPVIISTGFSDALTQQRIQQLGLSAVILKPIITRDLANAIRDALDNAAPKLK
jgi:PAS domain S-box-containing protein